MTNAKVEIEIEAVCDECGADLETKEGGMADARGRRTGDGGKIRVVPCEGCLEKAREILEARIEELRTALENGTP